MPTSLDSSILRIYLSPMLEMITSMASLARCIQQGQRRHWCVARHMLRSSRLRSTGLAGLNKSATRERISALSWSHDTLLSLLELERRNVTGRVPTESYCIVWAADGEWHLLIDDLCLWADLAARGHTLDAVRTWCEVKLARALILVTHVPKPAGILAIGLKSGQTVHVAAVVDWYERVDSIVTFDGPEWLTEGDIDRDIISLLPTVSSTTEPAPEESVGSQILTDLNVTVRKLQLGSGLSRAAM